MYFSPEPIPVLSPNRLRFYVVATITGTLLALTIGVRAATTGLLLYTPPRAPITKSSILHASILRMGAIRVTASQFVVSDVWSSLSLGYDSQNPDRHERSGFILAYFRGFVKDKLFYFCLLLDVGICILIWELSKIDGYFPVRECYCSIISRKGVSSISRYQSRESCRKLAREK